MSKLKLSFSFLLALLIVGIISTSAFAKNVVDVKATQNADNTFTVSITKNAGAPGGTQFYVNTTTVENGQPVSKGSQNVTLPSTYQTPVLDENKIYSIEVSYLNAPESNLGVVGRLNVTISDKSNDTNEEIVVDHTTDFINANNSGLNGYSKKRDGQKMHGSYQNNTNSCASCHQTHTGSDHFLLFRDGSYSVCASCHDGTMGAKGVFAAPTNAGTFGGTHEGNMSVHLTDGTVTLSAAPGGNKDAATGTWTNDFSCSSCHDPHGSDSTRLLKSDPAGWTKVGNAITGVTAEDPSGKTNGGMQFKDKTIGSGIYALADIPATNVGDYILVKQINVTQATITGNTFFSKANVPAGSDIISTYKWDYKAKKYVADASLWMQSSGGYGAIKTELKAANVVKTATADFVIVWKDGFAYSKPLAGGGTDSTVGSIDKVTYLIGSAIEKVTNNYDLFDSKSPTYVQGSGIEMSKFCASCHTDYLSATYANETGVFTTAHRHQTDTDRLTCVRCHYAHGTDATIMKDSLDRGLNELTAPGGKFAGDTTAALDYLKDPNPSSALKRYTGMSVCFGCHDGSIANDTTTWSNTSSLQPGLYVAPAAP